MADEGFATTITFSTGFFAEILNVDWDGLSRKMIGTSHMGTSGGKMTYLPSDLIEPGKMTVELQFVPATAPPITGAQETVTLTFPIPAGGSTHSSWAASGALESFKIGVPHDDKMTATAVIQFSGAITFTAGS